MPIQQIAVAPVRETSSDGKSAPRSKDKREGGKGPGRSGSRSSNISKASSSTAGLGTASQTSVAPSCQDICSSTQLACVEEDASEGAAHGKATPTVVMTINSTPTGQKRQVKRRHRRKKGSGSTVDCVDGSPKDANRDRSPSSDRSEMREKHERSSRGRRELSPRNLSDSSSEGGGGAREARSWSKEKARRGRRSGSSREREGGSQGNGGEDKGEVMELQSIGSDEGKENGALLESGGSLKENGALLESGGSLKENGALLESGGSLKENGALLESGGSLKENGALLESGGSLKENGALLESGGSLKKRHKRSAKREGRGSRRKSSPQSSHQSDEGRKSRSAGDSSSPAEEGEELITKRYQEKGSGGGDMSVPTPSSHCGVNGGTVRPCSEDSELEVCRICHCEGDEEFPLITPCRCTGSLTFVHQSCLNQWIKSSDTRCCELCKFDFIMDARLKPLRKWEKLQMTKGERRKIFCSVMFHLIAIVCVLWSVYFLVKRTSEEIRLGRTDDFWRLNLLRFYTPQGILEWPFWTKLIVVAISFTGGLIFMYIQCKVYLQLWRRLKAFNRIITVHNCPEKGPPSSPPGTLANGKPGTVEVPMTSAPDPVVQTDSDHSVEAAVAPV